MKRSWKAGVGAIVLLMAGAFVLSLYTGTPALAQKDGGKHFTVVATDGTHLVVTDNQANKVFFYAIEQGGKPGDDLKLRGVINLEDVGKPSLKPSTIK